MVVGQIVKSIPILRQASKFSRLAVNVTNCANPVQASAIGVKSIVSCESPANIKYLLNIIEKSDIIFK